MSLATSLISSTLLNPNVQGRVADLAYRGTDLLELLGRKGRVQDGTGGDPYRWNVATGTNTAATFGEGEAPQLESEHTYTQASLSVFGVRNTVGITGHMRDNIEKGAYYEDPLALEQLLSKMDVFSQVETQLWSSTQDRGLAAIIDSTGTYAGIAQGTVASWASEENAVSAAQSIAQLTLLYVELMSDSVSSVPRGHMPREILSDINQIGNYVATIDSRATTGSLIRINGGPIDGGFSRPGLATFNGMDWIPCRLCTATEVYMVDLQDFTLLVHRDLRVDPIVGNPENERWQISTRLALKVEHRNWHGKQTGVTA